MHVGDCVCNCFLCNSMYIWVLVRAIPFLAEARGHSATVAPDVRTIPLHQQCACMLCTAANLSQQTQHL